MKIVHVDGGSFIEPPDYKFHDAYFAVCDSSGNLIHFAKNIGDLYSGLAEYEAIRWAVGNVTERPLRITSDCITAIAWARKGSRKKSKFRVPPLNLQGIELVFQHGNHADQWNAQNHSKKHDKEFYIKRYYDSLRNQKTKLGD